MATKLLYRDDGYLRECQSVVVAVEPNGVILDQTVFYAMGGGQPGDRGNLAVGDLSLSVVDTRYLDDGVTVLHVIDGEPDSAWVGATVTATLDWERRHRIMRTHTLLHVLGTIVPAGVTGGSIRDDGTARLDFDLPDSTLDKVALNEVLTERLAEEHEIRTRWISGDELDASPELVRTMSVAPPRTSDRVRLLEIDGLDLQACGGTHVKAVSEIGPAEIRKIEKKGKHNRRVNVRLLAP